MRWALGLRTTSKKPADKVLNGSGAARRSRFATAGPGKFFKRIA
jgi:hypothetical protein